MDIASFTNGNTMKKHVSIVCSLALTAVLQAQELSISRISDRAMEVTLGSANSAPSSSPMLVDFPREEKWRGPVENAPTTLQAGDLRVEVVRSPLTITVFRKDRTVVQKLAWYDGAHGSMYFKTDGPVFGLGEGGGALDRSGKFQPMMDGYLAHDSTTRVSSPILIGTDGWALVVANLLDWPKHKRIWRESGFLGEFDLRDGHGIFRNPMGDGSIRLFLIGSDQPTQILAELRRLTGGAPMPPRWALGYMQSHRTLAGWNEVHQVAQNFREKKLPCDGLIYLSEMFCQSGWGNGKAPFSWNANNFPNPSANLDALHGLGFKVVLHATGYPANLHGDSIAEKSENAEHIASYWQKHLPIFQAGVDGWWLDDGEELTTIGRMARHRMYHDGPLQARPNERPWGLHRTMTPGAHRYGGWIWSGDPNTSWAALSALVPSALNCGLSLTPFWGSDVGGFICTPELSAELYMRWFQLGAFSPSFRAHGRNWHLRLPWGWNSGDAGPRENGSAGAPDVNAVPDNTKAVTKDVYSHVYEEGHVPKPEELRNAEVEPVCRKYLELRYALLPYNYTLAREACDAGLPMMRALWLHHPDEAEAVKRSDEYLWGRDLLVAPVLTKGAKERTLYLPRGQWFDWWTGAALQGGREITRAVDLSTLPLFVRAGAIIPLDPVRQFTAQVVTEPTELRIYPGADGSFTLYDDDGHSLDYLQNDGIRIRMLWNDQAKTLSLAPVNEAAQAVKRSFKLRVMPDSQLTTIEFRGTQMTTALK